MFWWSTPTANTSSSSTSSSVIAEVERIFSDFGVPEVVMSDNGHMIAKNFERIARAALFGPSRPAQHMHSLMG
jgi:hypothetical protein